jgi:membrane-associated protease RseP (regulator of RpoE activity)
MEWYFTVIMAVAIIAAWIAITRYIRDHHILEEHIKINSWYIMFIRTKNTIFLDKLRKWLPISRWVQNLSTAGVIGVVILLVIGFTSLILTVVVTLGSAKNALPAQVTAPNNILLIPGVTDFVPLSIEVIIALFLAMAIHEIGHGIIARVYNIKVNEAGLLMFVIPIGAYVDPEESEINNLTPLEKCHIYAAGISTNIIGMAISFIATIYLYALCEGRTVMLGLSNLGADFINLMTLPVSNILNNPSGLWITQYTATYMPYHSEPFFGCWFLLHLAFWTFWLNAALALSNSLPILNLSDGSLISKEICNKITDQLHLKRTNVNIATVIGVLVIGLFVIIVITPYIRGIIG